MGTLQSHDGGNVSSVTSLRLCENGDRAVSEYPYDGLPLKRAKRRTPYSVTIDFEYESLPSAGAGAAVWLMHIRHLPGDSGTPLISLNNAAAGAQGLFATVSTIEGVETTTLTISVSEATMEGLPSNARYDQPLNLYYDIHVTPPGRSKYVILGGTIPVDPGVTI